MKIRKFLQNIVITGLLLTGLSVTAQELDRSPKEALLKKESSGFLEFRSNGWGFGYRFGNFKTGYKKKMWDLSFAVVKDLKQYKVPAIGSSVGNRYYYGKQIHFYNFKALYGTQKIITTKPYWGGVELRRFFYSGVNIGVGVPIYVYVYTTSDGTGRNIEKFDADKHDYQDIYGKGPFTKGLSEMTIYPAISFKGGVNVEYGILSQVTKIIEVGAQLDLYPIPVQIMAKTDPDYYIFSIYVGFHLGKRYN